MSETVILTINGQSVTVPKGTLLIEAARSNGFEVPSFCYYRELSLQAACRLCLVEIEKMPKLQTSCTVVCTDGMVVRTDSPQVVEARKAILEFTLANHPLDCPVCDKGGECELQDMTFQYGPGGSRFIEPKEHIPEQQISSLIFFDGPRCILCYRCVRICDEGMDVKALEPIGRGVKTIIGPFHSTLDCEDCGNCIDICPVGALTSDTYRYKTRPWELKYYGTVCGHCSNGCKTTLSVRNNEIIRANNRNRTGINGEFLCVKGRFAFDFVNHAERLRTPLIRENGSFKPATWPEALRVIAERVAAVQSAHGADAIGVVASNRLTNEENYLLQKWTRALIGTNNIDHHRTADYAALLTELSRLRRSDALLTVSDLKTAKAILLIGDDPTHTQPLVAFQIRAAVRLHGAKLFILNSRRIKLTRKAAQFLKVAQGSEGALLRYLARPSAERRDEALRAGGMTSDELDRFEKALRAEPDLGIVFGAEVKGAAVRSLAEFGTSLTGNTRFMALSRFVNSRGAADVGALPHRWPGYQAVTDEAARAKFERAWEAKLSPREGLSLSDMLTAAADGTLKALLVFGSNPAESFVDPTVAQQALNRLELLVVSDLFLTSTAQMADVVLPAASFAEKEGTFTNCGGEVQRTLRAVRPSELVRTDLEMIVDLAQAMSGNALQWTHRPWHAVFREMQSVLAGAGYDQISIAELNAGKAAAVSVPRDATLFADEASLDQQARDVRPNAHDSLYDAGSLTPWCKHLVELAPRSEIQHKFFEEFGH